jgi:hypothetical protein
VRQAAIRELLLDEAANGAGVHTPWSGRHGERG